MERRTATVRYLNRREERGDRVRQAEGGLTDGDRQRGGVTDGADGADRARLEARLRRGAACA